ncbi:uncharacterized protein [Montipora foliosa]|uniref:uncharacterized protein n=1 Tax=Montipora foliosa TaxID=591990 RepID=UPI0035F20C4C
MKEDYEASLSSLENENEHLDIQGQSEPEQSNEESDDNITSYQKPPTKPSHHKKQKKKCLREMLRLILKENSLQFNGRHYLQTHGTAMGTKTAVSFANIFMAKIETEILSKVVSKPTVWKRNIADVFSLWDINHLNSINPHIRFTSEEEKNGRISFLDTCLHLKEDGSTKVTVYRKPTHTDQYLNFHSNHHLQHKRAVVNTLLLRAQTLVSKEVDRVTEIRHVKQA